MLCACLSVGGVDQLAIHRTAPAAKKHPCGAVCFFRGRLSCAMPVVSSANNGSHGSSVFRLEYRTSPAELPLLRQSGHSAQCLSQLYHDAAGHSGFTSAGALQSGLRHLRGQRHLYVQHGVCLTDRQPPALSVAGYAGSKSPFSAGYRTGIPTDGLVASLFSLL